MAITTPSDFNPYIHVRAPRTRVELLAWNYRESSDMLIRQSAGTILVASRLLPQHSGAHTVSKPLARYAIARHARKLRALTRK